MAASAASAKRSRVDWQMGTRIRFQGSNPKSAGTKSHQRYEKYKCAQSVRAALSAGAQLRDLDFDHHRGFLVVAGSPDPWRGWRFEGGGRGGH